MIASYELMHFVSRTDAEKMGAACGCNLTAFHRNGSGNNTATYSAAGRDAIDRLTADLGFDPITINGLAPTGGKPKSPVEALQNLIDVSAFIMEYGRVETGTQESAKLLAAYQYFSRYHGVSGLKGNVRKDPTFVTTFSSE